MARNSYNGPLSVQDVTKGINHCIDNASRLLDDAIMLADRKRWPSACALCILSIEESGKIALLRLLLSNQPELRRGFWKLFRDHHAKNSHGKVLDVIQSGGGKDALTDLFTKGAPHQLEFDEFKQKCFYVDRLSNQSNWSVPEEVCTEQNYIDYSRRAVVLIKDKHVSEREIQLFCDYMNDLATPLPLRAERLEKSLRDEGLTESYNQFFEWLANGAKPNELPT